METLKTKPPVVAIVGRINVGKSSLFNALVGKNLTVVDKTPGITRDAIIKPFYFKGREFLIADTGGLFSQDVLSKEAEESAKKIYHKADLLLFVVDGKEGVLPGDEEILSNLRKTGKTIIGVVNKSDVISKLVQEEFHRLGLLELFFVSSAHREGIGNLKERIADLLGGVPAEKKKEKLRVIILGRPNVGKSSLFNKFVEEDRSIVSPIPGTTRDALEGETKDFLFIDTSGIRRKFKSDIEYYSFVRTQRSLRFAECAIMMVDARNPMTRVDRKIFSLIEQEGRGMVISLNKADLLNKRERKEVFESIELIFPTSIYVPRIFTSCVTGEGIGLLKKLLIQIHQNQKRYFKKKEIQEFIEETFAIHAPSVFVYRFKFIGNLPLRFLIETKSKLPVEYIRFLINRLRERFGLMGCPIFIKQEIRK